MRVPVKRLSGKARTREDTPADLLSTELSKHYTVMRDKSFSYVESGEKKTMVADIALTKHSLIVEVQKKQDNKEIIAEMSRERVVRNAGWHICRFTEKDIIGDIDNVIYKVAREIERNRR